MRQMQITVNSRIDGTALKPIFISELGEVMLCGKIRWTRPVVSDDVIKLSDEYTEKGIGIYIDKNTDTCIFGKRIAGECMAYIRARARNDRCIADFIYPDIFTASLNGYEEPFQKHQLLEWFTSLKPQQRESIIAQLQSEHYDAVNSALEIKIRGVDNLLKKYNLTKATFTPQQQADIEEMFDIVRNRGAFSTQKQKAENRLQYLLNINTSSNHECSLTKSEIIAALDKELYKLDAVKEEIAQTIIASKYAKEKGMVFALLGNPGVGKTAVARAIAKVMDLPFGRISLGSVSTPLDVTGLCYTYDGSDAGEPTRLFYKLGTEHIVLLLDEFDKAVTTKEGNPQNAFNDMLSDEHFFKDAYLGTYIRTPDTVVILTMNSTENVPEHLLNRCTVIRIDDYDNDEKLEIVKRHILPSSLAQYHISPELVRFDDKEILYLLDNYCEDAGARDADKFVKAIVKHILSEWDESGKRTFVRVTSERIDAILGDVVDRNSDAMRYIRHKRLYSPEVSREIQSLREKLKRTDFVGDERLKASSKLHYLVSLVPTGDAFTDFDADRFYAEMNTTHYGMRKVKDMFAEIFYCKTLQKEALSSVRILLVGEPGIGKSSIVQTVANALHAPCRRISLNGVSDENVIKGHSYTYVGADAGKIVKAAADMGTTRGILHLDEVDKLGRKEGKDIADTLVDILDNSALLTDNFLGVPVDFSEMMFIATANDLSQVPKVILDRFIVIHLDGYSKNEKIHIAKEYILPKLERTYCPHGVSLHITDDTLSYLIDSYCPSSGVRDIEKALERMARHKLYITRNRERGILNLTEEDAVAALGDKSSISYETASHTIGF